MTNNLKRARAPADYNIACVCPMGVELAPVEGMLDEIHDPLPIVRAHNAYTLGSIGGHNIVIAIMPEIGNNAAATTITQLLNDFPAVRFGLLVGIGGGVPGAADVRLGDLVIGQPTEDLPAVVQYDMGKELEGGRFHRTGWLNKPPAVLNANVRKLDSQYRRKGHNLMEYMSQMLQKYPSMQSEYSCPAARAQDRLFLATYKHRVGPDCDQCDHRSIVPRQTRADHEPRIYYGTIGSANKVIKDADLRDRIRADTRALCVEMEAAGLTSDFPCLVIRGICDYADSHKNKIWQPYAAAVAAAYMKALLTIIPAQEVFLTDSVNDSATSPFKVGLHLTEAPVIEDDLFIGRASELQEMEGILQPQISDSKHRRLVLGGMGGLGKTQLAIAYAKRHCHRYDSTFWLNATSEAVMKHSIRLMAQRVLDVEKYQGLDDESVLLHVTRWLSDAANTRWLLILDNYDEPDSYKIEKYCPYGPHGSVIITTHLPEQVQGRQLPVSLLGDLEQSIALLETRSKRLHLQADPYARELAKRMQGLPLALATAGAYLKHSPWTFEQYLRIYEKRFQVDNHRSSHLLEYQQRTLFTTWDVSYVRLEADDPRAAALLRSFAFFDNQHLRYGLFHTNSTSSSIVTDGAVETESSVSPRNQSTQDSWRHLLHMSSDEFESSMRVLSQYCFVELQLTHQEYSIHNCVHDWALASLNASTQSNGYWFAFDRIANLVGEIKPDLYALPRYDYITPHAVRLTHVSFTTINHSDSPERWKGMGDIAGFLRKQSQLDAAEQMFVRALAGREKGLGPEHKSTLYTNHQLAVLYRNQNKFVKAEQTFKRVLAGYEKLFGPENTSNLNTVHELGKLYYSLKRYAEAEQMFQQALSGYTKVRGPEDASTLTAVHNLGVLYRIQGRLAQAETTYERALAGIEKALGREHMWTLITVHELGEVYFNQGKLAKAEQLFDRAMAGKETTLGLLHTSTLTTVYKLGKLYNNQGKLTEAEQHYKRALAGYRKANKRENNLLIEQVTSDLECLYAGQKWLIELE